ncbi:MAG: response regulator [Deltaproteobacteria bacterium]|jgi:two-component system cell cycle sensor histidine kinase/response regulator CckA|nr:response regulator [Deltaproteobacteria bacterium]
MFGPESFEETRTLAGFRRDVFMDAPTVEEQTQLPTKAETARVESDTLELQPTAPVPNLVILTGKNAGVSRKLGEEDLVIGRGSGAGLVLEDEEVSRQHARIRRTAQGDYILEDLGSRNGTLLNDLPPPPNVALKFGDRITLGTETIVLFTHHDSLSELLLHRQRMESIGRLAGGVAHDFNNLLGAILANVSSLMSTKAGATEKERADLEALDDIRVAASRAAELTGQLLGFARRGKYEQLRVDVTELCSEAIRLCRRAFGPSYRIEPRFEAGLILLGDPSQLHQALMNVLINARDSMPSGGSISIRTRRRLGRDVVGLRLDAQYVEIEIQDRGVGMTPEICQRVFEPFFTTKELGRGTGLGLATTYGVAKSHAGDVRVVSRVGEGSTFRLYLPLTAVPEVPMPKHHTQPVQLAPSTPAHTILVVDDEELCLRSIARLLKKTGYRLLTASSGAAALELYRQHSREIDLVLLDLMMPEMTGEEVARQLRQIQPDVRLLVMSGYTDDERAQRVIKDGARGFLRKPFDRDSLQQGLDEALRSRRPTLAPRLG